jgi:DNA (cytosine-5)-methyltransferase 1
MFKVFDFFSGCGGTSLGFQELGFDISLAIDFDKDATDSFKRNFPSTLVIRNDIREVAIDSLKRHINSESSPILFSGCAPCQPFSKQNKNKKRNDQRRSLLDEFARFVFFYLPDAVVVENVPGMQKPSEKSPFFKFVKELKKCGYFVDFNILRSGDFGVPQRRERLVLVASKNQPIALPTPSHGPEAAHPYSTVREWIYDLPKIQAGERCSIDPDHQASKLSEINLQRISATPMGKGRESWPEELVLNCHSGYAGHTDVYGRLHWDKPDSGLTTRCISYSNGRFGHPEQNRAISAREAACLQTFPRYFSFAGSLSSKARQIGNAVPPLMAKAIAQSFI